MGKVVLFFFPQGIMTLIPNLKRQKSIAADEGTTAYSFYKFNEVMK